ncbi:MAG: gliding motility-associated C-terminal domain-containing protein [Bacteroidales bacterium]|nr:gliding motility-associated C-terminal domain-containing protein [Bacteroidales bacterium]
MKRSLLLLAAVSVLILFSTSVYSQCSGGTSAGSITPTTAWQTVNAQTYTYYTFTASWPGQNFVFTFCDGGGSASLDTQLQVHDNGGGDTGFYNDDACGTGSELTFTAPAAGTYRISIYQYYCSTNVSNAGTLAYRILVPNEQDCLGAISVCQATYNQNDSFFGYGNVFDYSGDSDCSGLCLDPEDNSVWYTFQVQTSGVLDFRITPNVYESDYDWALFNLTNNDCSDLQNLSSNYGIIESCNSAYDYGTTGANTLSPNTNGNCAPPSSFGSGIINNQTINVTAGEIYYLNIQNWSATQNGYVLDFGNSTATIFDNNAPLSDIIIYPDCGDNSFTILFNENVECSSVNLTDFSISGPGGPYTLTDIIGQDCEIGGTTEREFEIVFTPAITTSGSFTINYGGSAQDLCGNTAFADSWNFVINPGVTITLTSAVATENQTVCNGNVITSITYSSTGATSGTITGLPAGVNGNFNSTTGAVSISGTPTANGVYNYTVSLTGSCGNVQETGTITVVDNVVATFDTFGPYCLGEVPASLPIVSNSGVTGSWSPSAINTSSAGTTTYTFTPAAGQCSAPVSIDITVSADLAPEFDIFGPYCLNETPDALPTTSNNGLTGFWTPSTINTNVAGVNDYVFTPTSGTCTSDITLSIVVTPLPSVLVDLSTPPDCNGENGIITVSASGTNPPYSGIGTYDALIGYNEFVITDANGCSTTDGINVAQPEQLIADIYKLEDAQCFGQASGEIAISISQGNPSYNVQWRNNSDNFTGNYYLIENLLAGNYSITISDVNGCSQANEVTINEPAKLEVSYVAGGPSCIGNRDGYIMLNVIGGTSPYVYIWDDMNLDTLFLDGLDDGAYHIIIRDANNCYAEINELKLNDNPVDCLKIPNAFTPNGDGLNDTWDIENIEMFPSIEVRVFNRWGQVIYQARGGDNPWDGTYDGKVMPTGTYIYLIQTFTDVKPQTGTVTIVH